jgi:hypothetical protein
MEKLSLAEKKELHAPLPSVKLNVVPIALATALFA